MKRRLFPGFARRKSNGELAHPQQNRNQAPHARFAMLALVSICAFASTTAHALSFDVEFRSSTYQVIATDTYDDLVLEHQSGFLLTTLQISGIDGLNSVVSAGVNADYSTYITTTFTTAIGGDYVFRVGTDWGRGGSSIARDVGNATVLDEFVTTDDIWWGNDWNNPDVLTTALTLQAGETYSFGWVGFEGCCGGNATFRFSVDGSAFTTLDDTNFDPYEIPNPTPEPGTATMLGFGLVGLALKRRTSLTRK